MKNIKKGLIIVASVILGLSFIIVDYYNEYSNYSMTLPEQNPINFFSWMKTTESCSFICNVVGNLGINILAAVVFLILVDWTLSSFNEQALAREDENRLRQLVERGMRLDPRNTLFSFSQQRDTLFSNQFFGGCNLQNLDISAVDFSGSNLTKVDFSNAVLTNASFKNCNLSGAIFDKALLAGCDFSNSNISDNQFKTAHTLWSAKMPDGILYDGRFNLVGDIKDAKQLGYDIVNNETEKEKFYNTNS